MFKQNLLYHNFQIFCIKQVNQASGVVAFGFKKGFVYNINIVCTGIHNKMCIYIIFFSCKQFFFLIRGRYNHLFINCILLFVEQVEKSKDNNENESLLNDNPEIDGDKLRQFLSKGEITVCHVRCVIVGCGKAGKTTLLKRLQNASYDELNGQIERTEMVDFHVNSFEVLTEEETIKSNIICISICSFPISK